MSDLPRMTESDETPSELRAMLASAARPAPLSPEDRAKILAGAAAIAAGTAASSTAVAAVAARATLFSAGAFSKVVGIAALVVGAGLGARALVARSQPSVSSAAPVRRASPLPRVIEAPSAVRSAPLPTSSSTVIAPIASPPSVVVPVAPLPSAAAAPLRPLVVRAAPVSAAHATTAVAGDEPAVGTARRACPVELGAGGLAAESRALAEATAALSTNPSLASACVRAIEGASSTGALRDEVLFVGFDAARRLGRDREAGRYAEALVARSASSSYAQRARRWLLEHASAGQRPE